MAIGIRGANPIWANFDLAGKIFDDSYWLYVLQNTLPYVPATVYHDPNLKQPWTSPIRFLGNGTLPNDIYFEPEVYYRLEFRKNDGLSTPSQADPLIYEVNNYIAGSAGGSPPVDTVAFSSSNQITNPQFALRNFYSPLVISSQTNPPPIDIGGGWFLELAGTGSLTLSIEPLNNLNANPSNAPYALHLIVSGWNNGGVNLRQRFQQNGMIWSSSGPSPTYLSTALTARVNGQLQGLNVILRDSNNTTIPLLDVPTINQQWNEFKGNVRMPAPSNPNMPPAAYVDYIVRLPSNGNIYITSLQLVAQDLPFSPSFEQDSIERQIDHTFHYYRNSMLRQAKESLLSGWDFPLNPWQFTTKTLTNVPNNRYTADQTIVVQQSYVTSATGNAVAVGRAPAANNFGFEVSASLSNNQFAIIQYIDPRTTRASWDKVVSSLVRLNMLKQNGLLPTRMKMRLIYRSTLPSTIGQLEPISSWTASGIPVFSAGWTAILPNNDPSYNLSNGFNELYFEGMKLPAQVNESMVLGVVLFTVDNMSVGDNIIFDQVSLAQSEFAIETTRLSYDDTLRRCQFYYSKSFQNGVVPAFGVTAGELVFPQTVPSGGNGISPSLQLPVRMRTAPVISLYNPVTATALVRNVSQNVDCTASGVSAVGEGNFVVSYQSNVGSAAGNALAVQWTANSLLGG